MCLLNLNYSEAVKVFDRALALVSRSDRLKELGGFEVYHSLAAVFLAEQRYEKAAEANAKARQLSPSDVRGVLQDLMIRSVTEKASGRPSLDELRARLRDRSERTTDSSEGIEKTLSALDGIKSFADLKIMLEGRSDQGTMVFGLTTPTTPKNKDVVVHLDRGNMYVSKGQFTKALKEAQGALRINPRSSQALCFRAYCLGLLDRVAKAHEDLDKAAKLNPSESMVPALRAEIYNCHGQPEEGLRQITLAIELGYPKGLIFQTWGEILISLGKGEEVMQAIRDGAINQSDVRVFLLRSKYYQQKKRYRAALSSANDGVELAEKLSRPNENTAAYWQRGGVYCSMEHYDEARQDMQRALERAPKGSFRKRMIQQRIREIENRLLWQTAMGPAPSRAE